jgi:4'-phosphopantetheinyl transferase
MPILIQDEGPEGLLLLVWRLTETEEELLKFLNPDKNDKNPGLEGISHQLRRRQKLVSRILLENVKPGNANLLVYSPLGKPQLSDKQGYISFSNTKNFVAFIYHPEKEVGVDIEEPNHRISKIAPRFVNEKEDMWIDKKNPDLDYYLIWGAKESVFKSIGGGGILFKNHIEVLMPEDEGSGKRSGEVFYRKSENSQLFHYHFRYLEDFVMVYTIAKLK